MNIQATAAAAAHGTGSPHPAPASAREHLFTVVGGLWMTVGLFLDGYFHERLDGQTESFLTPWHAVFYSGFAATALWLWSMARRRMTGEPLLRSLPPGYQAAGAGLVLFAAGGAGDAAWHTAFGVERGIDALLSPTHLVLFAGLVLVLTAPYRAARVTPVSAPGPWIVVASVTTAAALVGFFLNFVWGLGISAYVRVAYNPLTDAGEDAVIAAVASAFVTTVVLFGAARFIVSHGRVPTGAFTVLFGAVALLVSAAFDEDAEGVAAALVAGAVLDVCLGRYRAWARNVVDACFALASAVLWLVYLGLLAGLDGIEWQAELWLGTVVFNALAAYIIATLPSHPRTGGGTS